MFRYFVMPVNSQCVYAIFLQQYEVGLVPILCRLQVDLKIMKKSKSVKAKK